jgi:hypothetical protein
MGGINVGRWIAGGVAAGILIWLVEGAASVLYMEGMTAALETHGLAMDISPALFLITVLVSLVSGLVLVFFYAAARPRFGPGPRTAVIVAVALWLGGYFLSLIGYSMIGLYPNSMIATWGAIGLVEMILASILGAWIYREPAAA